MSDELIAQTHYRLVEALAATERSSRLRLDNLREAIFETDRNGRLVYVNRAWRQLLQHEQDTTLGKSLLDFLYPSDSSSLRSFSTPPLTTTDTNAPIQLSLIRADGTHVPAEMLIRQTEEGGWVGSFNDISDRKRAERTLLEASELKSRFLSMLSHEFRTPISAIQLASELLQDSTGATPPHRRSELFLRIESAVQRVKRMLDAVIAVSRTDNGKMPFHPRRLDVRELVTSILDECRHGECHDHEFLFTCEGEPSSATIDPDILWNILVNLLRNACMYSTAGQPVSIHLACRPDEAELHVADKGIGIPPEDQIRVFAMFERGSNVGHTKGTGLGLNIVHRLTALHGGTVTFQSTLGSGTTFTVRLPSRNVTETQ